MTDPTDPLYWEKFKRDTTPTDTAPVVRQALLNMALNNIHFLNARGSDFTLQIVAEAESINQAYDAWVASQEGSHDSDTPAPSSG